MDPTDGHVVDPFRTVVGDAPAVLTTMPQKAKWRSAEAPCPSSADVMSVARALSRRVASDEEWFGLVERAVNAAIPSLPAAKAVFVELRNPAAPRIWAASRSGADAVENVRSFVEAWPKNSAAGFAKRLFSGATCFTVSTRLDERLYKQWATGARERGVCDGFCIVACENPGAGMLLWFGLDTRTALPRLAARRWETIAKHLLEAVVARSHDDGGDGRTSADTERHDGPSLSSAQAAGVREKLRERAVPVLSDVEASSFRGELLRGDWRLLDHFDSDGRRYFTWSRVGVATDRSRALTKREKDVLARVATGQSDRSIALELRCSPSTVATHRLRATSKLGLRSRALLSQILASVAEEPS